MLPVCLFSLITQCAVKMGIILCDTDLSQGSHVRKVDESLHSLVSQVCLQLSLFRVFEMFSDCGFECGLSVVCVITALTDWFFITEAECLLRGKA
jgi:hypothetical protein